MPPFEERLLELGYRVAQAMATGDTMRWIIFWRHNNQERPQYQGRKREWK